MKKLLAVFAFLSLFSLPAFAQENPAFEIFGGYSLVHGDEDTVHGFAIAGEGDVTDLFGIVGEFGFYDAEGSKAYTFMAGPRVGYRAESIRPFAHVLLGGAHFTTDSGNFSETHFSMAFGGGLDISVNESFSIRPAQFDIISVKWENMWDNDLRYSAGVVLTF